MNWKKIFFWSNKIEGRRKKTLASTASPIEIHEYGIECTKFVVPSIGSTIQVGSFVIMSFPFVWLIVSSPRNLKLGKSLFYN